jgi:uncharacterized protein YqjF (DUF2071 family)
MAGREPEERVVPIVRQSWRRLSFLHWRVDADLIARRLPAGLKPELIDGSAWVAITPFAVDRCTMAGVPMGAFRETNLRTYVRHRDGRDGLWFLSIDVSSAANAAGGRAIGVPYFLSRMSVQDGDQVRYRCTRRTGPSAGHDITVVPGPSIEPDETIDRLTGRWRAFTALAGRVIEVAVSHEPWPLQSATVTGCDETLFQAAGLPPPEGEPVAHFSAGVDARLGPGRSESAPRS